MHETVARAQHQSAAPLWPIALWVAQGAIPLGVCAIGAVRIMRGPAPGNLIVLALAGAGAWLTLVILVAASHKARLWLITKRHQLLLSATMTVFAVLLVGEVGVRVISTRDGDGNVYLRGHHLHPYQLPVNRIEAAVSAYKAAATTIIIEDPDTGWTPRPASRNALYAYDTAGIRVSSPSFAYGDVPTDRTTRISIFGDSFTNGVDEPFADTWGVQLQEALSAKGRRSEVLNFGVPGYGMDQAYLRWRKIGPDYRPRLVVFGLQIENVKRNVNLLRPLYNRFTDLPFSKPRLLPNREGLEVLNVPAVPPEALASTVAKISSWSLAPYEAYYDPADYVSRPWHFSRLVTFLVTLVNDTTSRSGRSDSLATGDEGELALRILEAFRDSVESSGATFLVVHLPRLGDLNTLQRTGALPNAALLKDVQARFGFVETADAMVAEAQRSSLASLFNQSGHYSRTGNRVVAQVLAQRLIESD